MPPDRQLIQSYGGGQFRIAGQVHVGSVLVWPDRCIGWPATVASEISPQSLTPIVAAAKDIDILIVGCGARFLPPPPSLRRSLSDAGIVLEWMDTGAACRTFNVLLGEARLVAAALIAVEGR